MNSLLNGELGGSDVLAFYDDDVFCGLACLLTFGTITHILYIAIREELRGRHYGSQAISEIRRMYPENRIIADLEADSETAENRAQRRSRIKFYESNGFVKTSVAYNWHNENYVIYSLGGSLIGEEFGGFWEHYYKGGKGASEF